MMMMITWSGRRNTGTAENQKGQLAVCKYVNTNLINNQIQMVISAIWSQK